MRNFGFVILCLILAGCSGIQNAADQPSSIQGAAVFEQFCPSSCDDQDVCTEDSCSFATNYRCSHKEISPCCNSDGRCEDGETCLSCESDCGKCHTLLQLQQDANKIYRREVVFKKNKASYGKKYDAANSSDFDYYDSTFMTIIKITNDSMIISNNEDFRDFMEWLSELKFKNLKAKLAEELPSDKFEFYPDYKVEDAGALAEEGKVMKYSYWTTVYELIPHYKYGVVDRVYKQLTDPVRDSIIYLVCAPDLVVGVYSNQVQIIERFWSNLDESGYAEQLDRWLGRQADGAMDEAEDVLRRCGSN